MKNQPPLAGLDPADLLRQGASDDTFVDGTPTAFNPPPLDELAAIFPQFEIHELVGKGGMGAVYKVRQKDLDRIVALKILPPAISQSPEFSDRFTREARALAKLNHPGIVTLHEFGQQGGLYFILMEFVDGVNLAQLMKTGRISPREALAIVPQICDALQYAHDQGIVHRDIKPENLLLDRSGRVKVADFGIAKVVASVCDPIKSGDTPVPENQTLAGKIIGTPQYMAPEQIEHPSEVDHRADIYALGVVFYQMLTGELPGRNLQAPSRKVSIDVRLDEMVLRALEEKPERRYQTALEFRTVLDGLPPATPPPVPKRGMMRRWWWVFLVMIPLGTLLGFVAAGVVTYVIPKKYEAEAIVEVVPANASAITPAFLANQFQAIKSSAVLTAVAQELELPNRWMTDRETAVSILKAIISTQNIRGTDLITIKVRHTNREDAVEITNAVIRNYQRSFGGKLIVHETPLQPRMPVSPNVPLNLVIGSASGLLLSPLMALVLILLLHTVSPEKRKEEPRAKRSTAVMVVSIIAVLLVVGLLAGSIGIAALKLQAMAKESHEDGPMSVKEQPDASAEALRWLSGIDAGEYARSWKEAADIFRSAITESGWSEALTRSRKPLGEVKSRKLLDARSAQSLPGAPDGEYVVMQFETSFSAKEKAVETVTFMKQHDGTWKTAGYFIR